ncbi:hypothetical protein CNMCM6106_004339 [Aspergillus hiratsukae]|uniref:Uncharacterized protein n=1 Tax=Aspergillus hiratsukae TaxID=1194566 RepID=A0A8H6QBI8_9EURO|nr:hypothetical protein CNMCM6106_004339 [Aspergillus hiratsukae]
MKTSTIASALVLAGSAVAKSDTNSDVWGQLNGKIKHVIYLMLENRSFDNIAGYWTFNKNLDNLVNNPHCNSYYSDNYTVWGQPFYICSQPYEQEVPLNDPDHAFAGTSYGIFETFNPASNMTPTMGGFIQREQQARNSTPGDASFVIQGFSQDKTNVLATLAQNYAVMDRYFAEHPGPTYPNRQFATAGSSCGYVDNTDQSWVLSTTNNVTGYGVNCSRSIFEALSEKNISWRNYLETDLSDAFFYQWVQENAMDNIVHASQLFDDLEQGTLPSFSYYNVECCTKTSMHPTSNIATGELMIKNLYDKLRASKYWEETLLIVNFDEHGGFADHVPTPVGVPIPEDGISFSGMSDGHNVTYDFDRLGVRVLCLLISPWIPEGTLIHEDGTMYAANSEYTHSSHLHFLENLWDLGTFNNRVSWAKTYEHVFADKMRTDTPEAMPNVQWYSGSGSVQPAAAPYLLNQPVSYYHELYGNGFP